jgi:hypothetical protein
MQHVTLTIMVQAVAKGARMLIRPTIVAMQAKDPADDEQKQYACVGVSAHLN